MQTHTHKHSTVKSMNILSKAQITAYKSRVTVIQKTYIFNIHKASYL